jgi:hypothetical protein
MIRYLDPSREAWEQLDARPRASSNLRAQIACYIEPDLHPRKDVCLLELSQIHDTYSLHEFRL